MNEHIHLSADAGSQEEGRLRHLRRKYDWSSLQAALPIVRIYQRLFRSLGPCPSTDHTMDC